MLKKLKNLKIIKIDKAVDNDFIRIVNLTPRKSCLPEIIPQKPNQRHLDCSNVLSVTMSSAITNTNIQLSDIIIITVPDRARTTNDNKSSIPVIYDEFIMLDDAKNQNDETEKFTN